MLNLHEIRDDVMPMVLRLLKSRLKPGCKPTLDDWQYAYDIVWTQAAVETAKWKLDNLSIGEYTKGEPE